MAKVNKVTTNGTTYELQDYELNTKLSGFSGVVKNAAGTLSQAVAGTDYDYPVLKGTSAPSTSTKGSVGQRYVNTSARTSNGLAVEYVCVAAGSTYTWVSAGSTGASLSVIADTYSASSTYAIGDVVIYNGGLYKCTTTISSAEAWTSSHWSATTVDGLISNLQTTIATKVDKTTKVNGKALSSNITLSSTDIKMADNTTIEASMTSLKTSVSEGKALIAAAVTDKGVETAASSSFSTIADNIGNISFNFSGATANAAQILSGYKAWNNSGTLITGTLIPSSTITFVQAIKGWNSSPASGNFSVSFSYPVNFTSNNYIGIICLGSSTIQNPVETIGVVLFNKGNYTVLTGTNLSTVTVSISTNSRITLSAYNVYYPQYFGILLQY